MTTFPAQAAPIVFVSPGDAFDTVRQQLAPNITITLNATQHFFNILIERGVALIFLDAAQPNWRELALGCKNSAATRRIPICLVSDDEGVRAEAILAGADIVLSWRELNSTIKRIVAELARVPSPDEIARLACECEQALPALAREGLALFNRGEYYRQHDLFEELWMATDGPVRDLYRAILQVGVAYYQIERGNYRGALKMLQRSVQWIHWLPDSCQGIDVAGLRRDSYAVRSELNRLGPDALDQFDRALIKPIRWRAPDPET